MQDYLPAVLNQLGAYSEPATAHIDVVGLRIILTCPLGVLHVAGIGGLKNRHALVNVVARVYNVDRLIDIAGIADLLVYIFVIAVIVMVVDKVIVVIVPVVVVTVIVVVVVAVVIVVVVAVLVSAVPEQPLDDVAGFPLYNRLLGVIDFLVLVRLLGVVAVSISDRLLDIIAVFISDRLLRAYVVA